MYRSAIISSIFLTLAVTTCAKSVNLEIDEDVENATARLETVPRDIPLIHESKPDEKTSVKRSLLILMPTDEEKRTRRSEDSECAAMKGQKTKRCKSPIRGERLLSRVNTAKEKKNNDYTGIPRSRVHLLSLKNPNAALKHDSTVQGTETGDGEDRNVAIIKAIREKLKLRNEENVGATVRKYPLQKTSVIDDDKYVCYCREKNNPLSRKDTIQRPGSRQQWLGGRKNKKPDRKDDNKQMLPDGSRLRLEPIYPNQQPHQQFLRERMPPVLSRKMNPILQRGGIGGVPYVPYIYHIDPNLAMAPNQGASPTKISIPFNPVRSDYDSNVGQSASGYRDRGFHKNKQTVGQRPCPATVGTKHMQSPGQKIDATSTKTSTGNKATGRNKNVGNKAPEGNDLDYNLQSVHLEPSEPTTVEDNQTEPIKNEELSNGPLQSPNEENDLVEMAGDPTSENVIPPTRLENEYKTTGSEELNYSKIKQVTSGYSTSKGYSEEDDTTGYTDHSVLTSFDNSTTNNDGTTNTNQTGDRNYEANLQTVLYDSTKTSMDPIEGAMNTELVKTRNDGSEFQSSMNDDPIDPGRDEEDVAVGESNPSWKQEKLPIEDLDRGVCDAIEDNMNNLEPVRSSSLEKTSTLIVKGLTPTDENVATKNTNYGNPSNEEFFAEDYPATESSETVDNAVPLKDDYEQNEFDSDKVGEKMYDTNEEVDNEDDRADDSSMDETILSPATEDDYATNNDLVNRNNEEVAAWNPRKNEPGSPIKDPAGQTLPFCDNSLLQKSIKTVINNFATGDSAEMDGNTARETVDSTGNDLLREIVDVPNLRGIMSVPQIERTIVDRVKNLVGKLTGVPRTNLDGEWPTNVIRNNLRNMMAAAPVSETELPPNTVEERQFRNGKWITNLVTLEPSTNDEEPGPTDFQRLRTNIKNLLRDPAVGLQAAKQPAVQSMIVQSVRSTFKPANSTNEPFDESVIQNTLDNELNLMEMEDLDDSTTENTDGTESDNISDIDVTKILEIARNEAGINESSTSTSITVDDLSREKVTCSYGHRDTPVASSLNTGENVGQQLPDAWNTDSTMQNDSNSDKKEIEEDVFLGDSKEKGEESLPETSIAPELLPAETLEDIVSTTTKSSCDFVETTKNPGLTEYLELSSTKATIYSMTETDPITGQIPKQNDESEAGKNIDSARLNREQLEEPKHKSIAAENPSDIVASRDQDEFPTPRKEDYTLMKGIPSAMLSPGNKDENTEGMVGAVVWSVTPSTESFEEDASPEQDYAYLGKISVKKNNHTDDMQNLRNSELFYVGDGVKLPLEIRKLKDGSYALSISRKVCEHLLNKECPCCVPVEGNVVRAVRKQPVTIHTDKTIETTKRKRITKRESSSKSISANERTVHDSADDSIQIFSMPVESFARRYNLSLNLEKVQAPWNFDAAEKIDEQTKNRGKIFRNGEDNADANLLRNLLSVHAVSENGESETVMGRQANDDDSYEDRDEINYKYQRQRHRGTDRYRYERNIDETVNKRVEMVTDVLYWLRDMILSTTNKS